MRVVNYRNAHEKYPSTAVEIGSRAPDQHQRREQQEVGVDDPLVDAASACRACWIAERDIHDRASMNAMLDRERPPQRSERCDLRGTDWNARRGVESRLREAGGGFTPPIWAPE